MGIKPDYEGLLIDPCIPKDWKGYSIKRWFRGAMYDITVENPNGVEKGVKQVNADGVTVEGVIVPVFNDGKEHKVVVVMG